MGVQRNIMNTNNINATINDLRPSGRALKAFIDTKDCFILVYIDQFFIIPAKHYDFEIFLDKVQKNYGDQSLRNINESPLPYFQGHVTLALTKVQGYALSAAKTVIHQAKDLPPDMMRRN